jgi:fibronectin-binding autotransporter adhesin
LTLSGANGYSSSTLINAGTLGLANDGSSTFGSLASPTINVAAGATFDVSQVAAGYVLGSTKTIAGSGTVAGAFAAGTSANITPGGSGAQGTLTFANGLSTTNAAYNLELTSDPTGTTLTNDAVSITGDLTVSGVNNIVVTPVGSLGLGTYKLIKFTGNFYGDVSNFTCSAGTIVTNTGEIDLVVTSVRPLANLTWRGDGSANLWDIGASSNWLNGVSLDRFYTGDTNTFNDSATNFTVNLVGTLSPAPLSAVLVNATNDYLFTGSGDLHGTTGLTKTNSGRLVILSTNDYSGVTTVSGGTLSVAYLANGGSACAIGAAAGGSGDLVIGNGVFEYTGNNVSINRGATLTSTNSTLAVTNSVKSLTLSGTITGSGTLNKVGPGTLILSSANSYGATTVSNGNLQINNTTAAIGSGLLTLAGGRLDLYSGGSQPTVANNINVTANSSLYVHGNNTVFSGSWTGNQTINVTVDSGGYFTLDHDISSFAGTISMGTSAGNFRLNAGGNGSGAQNCTGSASAAFDLGTGSVVLYNRNGGTNTYGIYNLGRLSGGSGTQLKGASNGGAAINASYYSIGARNEDSEFDGTIVDGGGGSGATTAIIKVGTGTLTLSGANTYTGTTVVSNGTLQVNGSLSGSSVVTVAGGKLGGIGTIGGATTLNSGATLEAGIGDIGTLTFSGNLNLNAASTNAFVVTTDGGTSNSVAVQGQLSPNGSVVKVTSGSPLAIGTYPLFTYSTVSGSFNAVPVFDVAPAANASIQDNGSGQINIVISTGPSGPASITNSISGSTLTLGWPAGQNWRLEGQTNNLSTGLSPTGWGTVSGAGVSDGNATITIDPNQPSVFYRLVYP